MVSEEAPAADGSTEATESEAAVLERQIQLLEEFLADSQQKEPAQMATKLAEVLNPRILRKAATIRDQEAIKATAEALQSECQRLRTEIKRRHIATTELREYLESSARPDPAFTSSNKPLKIPESVAARFQRPLSMLSHVYLGKLGLGDPKQIENVLCRLVSLSARNEFMIAPTAAPVTQFLVAESLVYSEPVDRGKVRLRLW